MTKKTFIAIAAGFKQQLAALDGAAKATNIEFMLETLRSIVRASAEMFADIATADNPRFDRQRFLAACGF